MAANKKLKIAMIASECVPYAKTGGLACGHYTATLTVSGPARRFTQNSPQIILVDLWVFNGTPPKILYLPLVRR